MNYIETLFAIDIATTIILLFVRIINLSILFQEAQRIEDKYVLTTFKVSKVFAVFEIKKIEDSSLCLKAKRANKSHYFLIISFIPGIVLFILAHISFK